MPYRFLSAVEPLPVGLGLLFGIGVGAIAVWLIFVWRSGQRVTPQEDIVWLHHIYEHAELGMNLTTPDGRLVRVNQTYCQIFGYSSDELLNGMRWQDITHPADRHHEEALIQLSCIQRMPAYALEQRCIRRDGTLIWVKIHASQVYDQQGRVRYIAAVVEEISDRKAAQLALERSERELQAMFASMTDVVLTLDHQGRYLKVISPSDDLLREPAHQLLGKTMHDVFPAESANHFVQCIQQVLATGKTACLEYPVEVNGKTLWFAANMSPLSADSVICVARDISDHHQAELALRHSEATNRAILEAIPDLLLRIHKDGTYAAVVDTNRNKSMQILPYAPGSNIYEVLPSNLAKRRMEAIVASLETGQLQIYEQVIVLSVDRCQEEEVRVMAINDDETLVMVRDISDRKRAERVLQQQACFERALNQVTQTVRNSLNVTSIYATAVREFAHLLAAQQAILTEYVPVQQVWRNIAFYSATPTASDANGVEIPDVDDSLTSRLKQGEVVHVTDTWVCQDMPNQHLASLFPGPCLILPIYYGKQLWGTLGLYKAETPWQDSEIQLAKAITDQLAIAIQQAELYQQLQNLNTHLEQQVEDRTAVIQKALTLESLLKRITDKVRDSLDENQIVQAAVDELGVGLKVVCCNASLYSADLMTCKISHEYSVQETFGLGQDVSFQQPIVREIINQLIQAETFQVCFPIQQFAPVREEYYAVLMCPILDDHGILGDLWLFRPKEDNFSDLDIRIVQQVANQCAIALRQSRLYQLAQAQVNELARLNQLKDDFLSTVSHELRTPMSNIKMATQMLEINLNQFGVLEGEGDRVGVYLKILQDECQRETNLINDLLDLSRLDASCEPLVVSTMNLTHWLPHVAEVFAERTRTVGQRLVVEMQDPLPALTTDFAYLELVLMELLHNACKYTPLGETILFTAHALDRIPSRSPFGSEGSVQVQVANSGVVIPSEELSHVFEKFYRVPNNDPWKHGGTGLGLALVKKRVERIRGTIAVTSADNWTTFTLQLPQLLDHAPHSSPLAYSWTH